ncbi:hypothetical protein [Haloarcula salinisoli]|uniref:Uncharacterized protein n=1 Tax=Haloarcula salinisoli TaxID=2487746 RepID=A0A8J8C8B4_9EURY|nr:hypothetical protein [Halomicroarcula salinisoli]MBX0286924.1 hypothetical protein [Halomicroarcula salinisoli]MBX0304226.1 hypothetical protein [Halomicroarcula salinisoli]
MPTRRSLLGLVAAGLAGCQSPSDARLSTAAFPALEGDRPTFRRWLPAVPAVEEGSLTAVNVARLTELRSTLPASDFESIAGLAATDYFGRSVDELEGALWLPSSTGSLSLSLVYPGSYDVAAVEDALTAGGYERYDGDGSARFYRRPGTARVAAASPEAVVMGVLNTTGSEPERGFVAFSQQVFAAGAGLAARAHDRSAAFEQYTDSVGWPVVATGLSPAWTAFPDWGAPESLEGEQVARGSFVREEIRHDRFWLTAADPSAVVEDIRTIAESGAIDAFNGLLTETTPAIRTHENAVDLAFTRRRDDGPTGTYPPMATLDATLEGETVTVTHLAGEPVAVERLSVPVRDGRRRFGSGRLTPGDTVSVTLSGEPPDSLDVFVETSTGDVTRVLSVASEADEPAT